MSDLAVTCWCEAVVVSVPVAEVRAGSTRSCGRSVCRGPDGAVVLGCRRPAWEVGASRSDGPPTCSSCGDRVVYRARGRPPSRCVGCRPAKVGRWPRGDAA